MSGTLIISSIAHVGCSFHELASSAAISIKKMQSLDWTMYALRLSHLTLILFVCLFVCLFIIYLFIHYLSLLMILVSVYDINVFYDIG